MTPFRCAAGLFAALAAGAYLAPAQPPPNSAPPAPNRIVGATSCAAAACHGNDGPKGAGGSELHTVAEFDPHRRAFAVLFQERSERMVRLLAAGADHAPAHRTELCLRCHGSAPPNAPPPPPHSDLHRSANCENCHGTAGDWLTTHYTRGWKRLLPEEKKAHGFIPTKDLAVRSQLCATCHVGRADREVDHKLIAAGHPALRFELAGFQAEPVYTRHWRERSDEAYQWAVGQVGTARAAVKLLRHRAGDPHRDWPELAEHTCFACHQGLTGLLSGEARTNRPRPGTLPWGSWNYPAVTAMADGAFGDWCRPVERQTGLAALADLFRRTDRPPQQAVVREATRAAAELDRWLKELNAGQRPLRPDERRAALAAAAKFAGDVPKSNAPATDWDRYTQGFLATAALYRSAIAADPAARDPAAEADLKAAAAALRFPASQDAPRKWTADEREAYTARWRALADRLAPGGRP